MSFTAFRSSSISSLKKMEAALTSWGILFSVKKELSFSMSHLTLAVDSDSSQNMGGL